MLRKPLNITVVICVALVHTPSAAQVAPPAVTWEWERALIGVEMGLAAGEISLGTLLPTMTSVEGSLLMMAPTLAAVEHSLLTLSPSLYVMGLDGSSSVFVDRHADTRFPQDTADAVYRRARAALNDREFQRAVDLFRQIIARYAQSRYVPQSMYYEAVSLYRMENERSYRTALEVLDRYRSRFPDDQISDAEQLYVRIQGQLARRGDSDAAAAVAARAAELAPVLAPGYVPSANTRWQGDDDDVRMQALNALLQMNAESAMPILRDVLANRASDRVHLRRRAVFLVAQKRTEGREEILLDAARNDPDLGVREQAVQWLAQVRTDAAVSALDSILQSSTERSMQQRAIMALSQHRSERSAEILREYALRADADVELRAYAIQWLGQKRGNSEFLRDLYPQLENGDLKERALFALSQRRTEENAQFLFGIAMDETEDIRMRTRALFWMGQMRGVNQDLYALYDRIDNRAMKEQLIAVYGQRRRDSLAVDQLIAIARNEQDTELRGKAIFWLGQTRDSRAIAVLREIINR